jgi:hypothetical protein
MHSSWCISFHSLSLDGYKRSLVSSLSANLQRFGMERVAKVESLQEIIAEMSDNPEPGDTAQQHATASQEELYTRLSLDQFPSDELVFRICVINGCRDEPWQAKCCLHDKHGKQQLPGVGAYLRTD